jgi:hypothetical protein
MVGIEKSFYFQRLGSSIATKLLAAIQALPENFHGHRCAIGSSVRS